jgi:hypothetical protein
MIALVFGVLSFSFSRRIAFTSGMKKQRDFPEPVPVVHYSSHPRREAFALEKRGSKSSAVRAATRCGLRCDVCQNEIGERSARAGVCAPAHFEKDPRRAALDFAGDMLDSALELVRDERVPEIVSVPLVFAATVPVAVGLMVDKALKLCRV